MRCRVTTFSGFTIITAEFHSDHTWRSQTQAMLSSRSRAEVLNMATRAPSTMNPMPRLPESANFGGTDSSQPRFFH